MENIFYSSRCFGSARRVGYGEGALIVNTVDIPREDVFGVEAPWGWTLKV